MRYDTSSFKSLSLSSSSDSFSADSSALRLPNTNANFEIISADTKSLAHDILWFSYSSYILSTTLLLAFLMKFAGLSMTPSFDNAISFSFFLAVGEFFGSGFAASSTFLSAAWNISLSDSESLFAVAIYMLRGV